MRPGILERDAELAVLAAAVRDAAGGHGSVVLISGEAGIGKSSLVEAVRAQLPAEGRLLIGYCDDLATPRTLGPFRDLVGSVGTELSHAVADGSDRDRLLAALRAELDWADHPAVLVVEDVHWADDATLDALRYLIRRIAALPAVLVLTYRDDELTREHALGGLLGQASRSDQVRRLPLRRLSAGAVHELSAGSAVNGDDLYQLTAGNPFFVHELLVSARGEQVPPSIADAVLARVRRLDPVTQDVLEQLAVVPAALEPWLTGALMAGLAPDSTAVLAAAEQRGLLTVSARRVAFRHELTRRAIAGAVPAARLIALNKRVLDALTGQPGADVAQIVHHAAQAGDTAAIVAYGPAAARDAARAGAHREAAAHYRLVLEHADRFPAAERAALLEEYSIECYTLGAADAAVQAQRQAAGLNRSSGDAARLGASLRWLSRMYWWAGDREHAEQTGREAVRVLEQAGDRRLLALALSNQSQLSMLAHRPDDGGRIRRARGRAGPRGGRRGDHVARADQHRHGPVVSRRPGRPADDRGGPPGRAGRGRHRGRLPRLRQHHLEPARLVPARRGRGLPGRGHETGRGARVPRFPWLHAGGAGPAGPGPRRLGRRRPARRAGGGRARADPVRGAHGAGPDPDPARRARRGGPARPGLGDRGPGERDAAAGPGRGGAGRGRLAAR